MNELDAALDHAPVVVRGLYGTEPLRVFRAAAAREDVWDYFLRNELWNMPVKAYNRWVKVAPVGVVFTCENVIGRRATVRVGRRES